MATTLSSLSIVAGGALGFRRNGPRLSPAIKAVSPLSSRSHFGSGFRIGNALGMGFCNPNMLSYLLSRHSKEMVFFRFGNALKLPKNRRSQGFASETNPNTEPPNANKSSSSGSGSPPPTTILAGMVVFLIVLWVVGSIVLWIVGLIVNVPKS